MGFLHESMKQRLVARGALNFRTYADLMLSHQNRTWDAKSMWNQVQRMPAGPAVVITPWNAPFMLSTWKLAPALAAGNSVVHKPSRVVAAFGRAAGRAHHRGRLPAWCLQPGAGHRGGGGCRAGGRPSGAAHHLHRVAGDRPPHRTGRGGQHRSVHRGAGRQRPLPSVRRRRPRRRRPPSGMAVRRLRPGVPSRDPPTGGSLNPRRVPRAVPAPRRRPRARRPPRPPPPTSLPWPTPTTATESTASSNGRRQQAMSSCGAATR